MTGRAAAYTRISDIIGDQISFFWWLTQYTEHRWLFIVRCVKTGRFENIAFWRGEQITCHSLHFWTACTFRLTYRTFFINWSGSTSRMVVSTLVRVKDKLPAQKQRSVVYKIPCSDCPSSCVDQTGRQFGTRMKKHKGAVRRQDENSLLALRCLTTGHAFDWGRATVVGKGTRVCGSLEHDLHMRQPEHEPWPKLHGSARVLEETNA